MSSDMGKGKPKYCLTKADLADAVYATLPVDKQKAAQIVEDYIELIKDALEKEGKVMFRRIETIKMP